MARKRMIDPAMFSSSTVSAWAPATRWTWAGLFCYLDNYGYGDDSAALVRASVWPRDDLGWPYTVEQVAADLDTFTASDGALCRFVCCGKPTIHIPKWREWQSLPHPGLPRFCVCPHHTRSSHEEHLKVSRNRHETFRLKESSSIEQKEGGDEPPDLPLTGSGGPAPARAVVEQLRQRRSPENQRPAESA